MPTPQYIVIGKDANGNPVVQRVDDLGIAGPLGGNIVSISNDVVIRPLYALGVYQIALTTGTMAAGIGSSSPIFSFRWNPSDGSLALLDKVIIAMTSLATGFAAGVGNFDINFAAAFTASDTGGTAFTPITGHNQKLRSNFRTSLLTDGRISSTAALGAGTRSLDANPFGNIYFAVPTTANTLILPTTVLYNRDEAGEYPPVFVANEGFVLRATLPATGTWAASITVAWSEVANY